MLTGIDNVQPQYNSQTRGHQDQSEELLVLIGEGSEAGDVLTFLREMWPEVEAADRGGVQIGVSELSGLDA
jgi:hypothetical protein